MAKKYLLLIVSIFCLGIFADAQAPCSVLAGFTTSSGSCLGSCSSFTNTSSGGAVAFSWNFGNGSTSAAASPVNCYTSAGTYTVTLVASNGGCSDTAKQVVIIGAAPIAMFKATPNPTSPGTLVTFSDTMKYSGKVSYYWNFGDGTKDTGKSATHAYSKSGKYAAYLAVTSQYGCSDTALDSIIILPVGIQSINSTNEVVSIYPNPNKGEFTIKSSGTNSQSSVEVFNVLGGKVYSELSVAHFPLSIDISAQPTGMYFVKITSGQSTKVIKVVKE
jgi:PKD repeat protein